MIVNSAEEIFSKISKESFREMLGIVNNFQVINTELLISDYYGDNAMLQDVYNQWEQSVKEGKPNYSLYGADVYMTEAFNCWKTYSRRYLLLLKKYLSREDCPIKDVHTVLDLGCGNGYTTVGLSALFPDATIYGTNLKGTTQFKLDEAVTYNIPNCHILDESMNGEIDADLIFASEFFEHLTEPLNLLRVLIEKKPKYIVFANTFTQMSLGHFTEYYDEGKAYEGKEMSRMFGKLLRQHGYVKQETGFFNNRPSVYMYKEPPKLKKLW